ncbi:MAG: ntrC 1 [Gemmataceae bacterium]|nr:ntrC 1 [Gemmataceae bacterium]
MSRPEERTTTVLVVDDEDAIRRVVAQALSRAGMDVLTADRGETAVDVYRRHRDAIDVVLLDVRMAPWDGPRTLAELRAIDPDLRAAFMTGASGAYSAEDLLAFGAVRVFEKPFRSLPGLAQALRDLAAATSPT